MRHDQICAVVAADKVRRWGRPEPAMSPCYVYEHICYVRIRRGLIGHPMDTNGLPLTM
jgi:hypothetical protein